MQRIIQEKFTTIGSTHSYAVQKTDLEKETVYIVTAKEQASGVGRRGSRWISPIGNLYCSLILPSTDGIHYTNQILAYVILKVLKSYDIETEFKWPNDLLYKGRKICGILSQQRSDALIISFGLNVNTPLENRASMSEIKGQVFELDRVQALICDQFQRDLDTISATTCIQELRKHLAFKQQMITYELNQKHYRAKLLDIADTGELVVGHNGVCVELRCASSIRAV